MRKIFFIKRTYSSIGPIPVTVDGPLKELHRILSLSELPVGWSDLGTHPADTGVALESVSPPPWLLVHHLQDVPATPLRCGQLLEHKNPIVSFYTPSWLRDNKCSLLSSCVTKRWITVSCDIAPLLKKRHVMNTWLKQQLFDFLPTKLYWWKLFAHVSLPFPKITFFRSCKYQNTTLCHICCLFKALNSGPLRQSEASYFIQFNVSYTSDSYYYLPMYCKSFKLCLLLNKAGFSINILAHI